MSITSTRTFEVTFAKPCPACGGVKGAGIYGYANGLIVNDTWACACGRIYYAWTWESSMLAAREARAAWADRNAPVSAKSGQPSKPDKPAYTGQGSLW